MATFVFIASHYKKITNGEFYFRLLIFLNLKFTTVARYNIMAESKLIQLNLKAVAIIDWEILGVKKFHKTLFATEFKRTNLLYHEIISVATRTYFILL